MLRGQSTVSFTLHSCLLWANGIFAILKMGKLAGLRNVREVRHLAWQWGQDLSPGVRTSLRFSNCKQTRSPPP